LTASEERHARHFSEGRREPVLKDRVFDLPGWGLRSAVVPISASVRVNAHLYMQWLQNPQLPFRENDRNDWYYVGAAAAHADVVVTERHFAHVVNTGGLVKNATVISDLMNLPSA
jgi:hypothetical protein